MGNVRVIPIPMFDHLSTMKRNESLLQKINICMKSYNNLFVSYIYYNQYTIYLGGKIEYLTFLYFHKE